MIGALLIATVLHSGGVSLRTLAVWGLAIGLASAGVLLFERYVARVGITVENCRRLAYVRIGLGAGIALLYGLSGFLLPGAVPAADTFLFIIVSTLVTVGALGYAMVPAYYLTLNAVSLLPLTGHFLQQYLASRDSYYLLLLMVSIIWQAVVLTKAHRASLTAIDAIVLNERLKDEVEEHRRTREAMRHMALHDELTGLGNRRYFEETATRTLKIAARDQTRFGLLVVDLNDFCRSTTSMDTRVEIPCCGRSPLACSVPCVRQIFVRAWAATSLRSSSPAFMTMTMWSRSPRNCCRCLPNPSCSITSWCRPVPV